MIELYDNKPYIIYFLKALLQKKSFFNEYEKDLRSTSYLNV